MAVRFPLMYDCCDMRFSRREFGLAGSAALAATQLRAFPPTITAEQVTDRIRKNVGVPWQEQSLDNYKAGDPTTAVSGIAVSAMATLDVLKRAVQQKANLIITLEPVFFGKADGQPPPPSATPPAGGRGPAGVAPDDPVLRAKQDFIQKNGMVVWRFADHWRARTPDPMAIGFARTLAWTKYQVGDDVTRYELPATSLSSLVDDLAKRLNARGGIRVLGDPQTRVRRVAILPGLSPVSATLKGLPECDVIVAGETREWESVEYAQDNVAAGRKKGFIMVGKILSEDPGMNVCAEWLKRIVPEVSVRWLPAGDPYWRPA